MLLLSLDARRLTICLIERYEEYMVEFAEPPMSRDQLVLFPDKHDNSIGSGAPVRLLAAILDQLIGMNGKLATTSCVGSL